MSWDEFTDGIVGQKSRPVPRNVVPVSYIQVKEAPQQTKTEPPDESSDTGDSPK